MQIYENLNMLLKQLISIIYSPFNRLLILACSSQIASMIAKLHSIEKCKTKKIDPKKQKALPSSSSHQPTGIFRTLLNFGASSVDKGLL